MLAQTPSVTFTVNVAPRCTIMASPVPGSPPVPLPEVMALQLVLVIIVIFAARRLFAPTKNINNVPVMTTNAGLNRFVLEYLSVKAQSVLYNILSSKYLINYEKKYKSPFFTNSKIRLLSGRCLIKIEQKATVLPEGRIQKGSKLPSTGGRLYQKEEI